jgi:TonB family protein
MKPAVAEMSEMWKRWEGQVVNGTFHLGQYLGGSKQGGVFLTEHAERKDQKAAIKLIAADPASADLQLSRWGMAAKLVHPHLIRLYHMGRCRLDDVGLLFLVMEYAEENLLQLLPQRALTAAEAHDMLAPTLDTLAYLHHEGFAHGHLKPANIMAVGEQIKLSSDGLWWMGEPSVELGNSGPYDPPEKATSGISPAGDVWSLGVTLVQALTRRVPVGDGIMEAGIVQTLPPPFLDIASHCLRREPQQRWTIAEIAARVKGSQPPQREQPAARPQIAFAKKRLALLAVALAAAVMALLAVPRLLHHSSESKPVASVKSHEPAPPARAEKPKAGQPAPATRAEKPKAAQPAPTRSDGTQARATMTAADVPAAPAAKASAGTPTRGEAAHEVVPDVPKKALDTIQGTVRVNVRVHVDPAGNVTAAEFDSTGPSKYFARLAMQAAQLWKFTPAHAQDAAREWILRFEFQRSGARVHPVQATP